MADEYDVIDAEIVSEKTIEAKPNTEPKKVRSDVSTPKERLHRWSSKLLIFARSFLLVAAIAGLTFTILHSQSGLLAFLILLAIFWSLTGLCLLAYIIGLVLHFRLMKHIDEEGGNA